ncbi:DJ-1/PfpI family protein [Hirsutella rhossiliensis]|uniref:DJ-1/PfpI family domain-containing protein n=1 Tax=Hirsutella rhossiliensis TaxID=111463 RepID=A0A9P8N9M9_9HYPO|nr:DJ-1/PfpI family domain-containing protein [Hirsutella rhossiliensis]KAH0968546.1 DJ-1/PfpI family domain-containing protein [Hirsutella rhossiliensis]
MKLSLSTLFLSFAVALGRPGTSSTSVAHAGATPVVGARQGQQGECVEAQQAPAVTGSELRKFGVVLFPGFDMIDVFGTLEPLQLMAHLEQQMTLSLIAETLEPVTTETQAPGSNAKGSIFWPKALPNNTFKDDLDLDVLIVPGGPGVRNPDLPAVTEYIAKMFPKVKILITICTGSGLAARAGILDGKMATTNKNAWKTILPMGPQVKWVSPARYIVDGKIWTSSGVTSSLDLVMQFIKTFWSPDTERRISSIIEHVPRQWNEDPFSKHFNITPTEVQPCPDRKQ